MKDVKAPVNARIIRARNAAGYTQENAALALGMKKNTYARMERYGNPSPDIMIKLAELYNVDIKALLYGEKHVAPTRYDKNNMPTTPVRISDNDKPIINNPIITLTATETSVVGGFRTLKPDQKKEIINLINTMRENNKKKLMESK